VGYSAIGQDIALTPTAQAPIPVKEERKEITRRHLKGPEGHGF